MIIISDKEHMLYRKTQQRQKILELLKHTDTHPTADWIYFKLKDEIPDLSLGTVYRNLKILMDQGEIIKLPFGSEHDRFDGNVAPHYHFICQKCGNVSDFDSSMYRDVSEYAQKKSNFKINYHRIDFFGLCANCLAEDSNEVQT